MDILSKKRIAARLGYMKTLRDPHIPDWKRITEVIRPSRGIYDIAEVEKSKKPTSMVNSTPATASRTCQAGMIAGASSSYYPWFKFVLEDESLMRWSAAKIALEQREKITMKALAQSNFYTQLEVGYGDAADFGNTYGIIDEHPVEFIGTKIYSPGEYYIDVNDLGDVCALYVEVKRTAYQLIQRFGLKRVSQKVRNDYDQGNYGNTHTILMGVEDNTSYNNDLQTWQGKPFIKFFHESNNKEDGENNFLEVSGYHEWPVIGLRWNLSSNNVWGNGPGLMALGDSASLQTLEFRDAQAIEKAVKPPLGAPVSLKNYPISHAPGGVTFYDNYVGSNQRVEPLYTMQAGILGALDNKGMRYERRVNEAYFKDLFLMFHSSDRREVTAREIVEKNGERLTMLGPTLSRTHRELLGKAVMRTYRVLDRAGAFPPAPKELSGQKLGIEYSSVLAYAQRAAGATAIERFFGFAGNLAASFPSIRHKIDEMEAMDIYADAVGVPATVMRDTKKALALASQEAQAAQGGQQAGAVKDMAAGAELLSRTDTTRPSALSFLLNQAGAA